MNEYGLALAVLYRAEVVLAFCIGKSQPHDHAPPLAWINILDEQFWLLYHLNLNVP